MPENTDVPIEGADQTDESQTTGTETDGGDDDGTEDFKSKAAHWRRVASKKDKTLADLQAELESLRAANQTEHEKAIEAAKKAARKEAEAEWKGKWQQERLTTAAIRVLTGKVIDPRLALPHLSLDGAMDEDGQVDEKALKKAVDDLLDEYPALALSESPAHHLDLGPKRTTKAPQNMNDLLRRAAGRM